MGIVCSWVVDVAGYQPSSCGGELDRRDLQRFSGASCGSLGTCMAPDDVSRLVGSAL